MTRELTVETGTEVRGLYGDVVRAATGDSGGRGLDHGCSPITQRPALATQLADDDPERQRTNRNERRCKDERQRVGAGLGDDEARDERREHAREIADEVVDAGPETHLVGWRTALKDDQQIAGRESDETASDDQHHRGARARYPRRWDQ